jgi:hypothetical protein
MKFQKKYFFINFKLKILNTLSFKKDLFFFVKNEDDGDGGPKYMLKAQLIQEAQKHSDSSFKSVRIFL